MSKLFIEDTTLTAIGDAIREKTGKADLIAPGDMPAEIGSITTGGGEVEPIELTGNQMYGCAGALAGSYINMFGNTITTKGLNSTANMFRYNTAERIPFELNYVIPPYQTHNTLDYMFYEARNLRVLPKMNNCTPGDMSNFCNGCYLLREIPENFFDTWDWSYWEGLTNSYSGNISNLFTSCYSLRRVPLYFIQYANPKAGTSYTIYQSGFSSCYALDEVVNLPIPYTATWTSNGFSSMVNNCFRLKNFIFETPDGQPKVVQWKSQTLDLTTVGYTTYKPYILIYNSGITEDKEVKDDATYQALKNDSDWFATKIEYSRYNHDSAVATINSLPDASAYGTNTIKFKGAAGSKTDGGAINTLTEEEIAVAAAKGWTVTLV